MWKSKFRRFKTSFSYFPCFGNAAHKKSSLSTTSPIHSSLNQSTQGMFHFLEWDAHQYLVSVPQCSITYIWILKMSLWAMGFNGTQRWLRRHPKCQGSDCSNLLPGTLNSTETHTWLLLPHLGATWKWQMQEVDECYFCFSGEKLSSLGKIESVPWPCNHIQNFWLGFQSLTSSIKSISKSRWSRCRSGKPSYNKSNLSKTVLSHWTFLFIKTLSTALSSMVLTSHRWLLSTWNMASGNKELNF